MNFLEQYMFDELVELYGEDDLNDEDYAEIYRRFCYLDHLEETRPYILAMRFMGWGTEPNPENVLKELEKYLKTADYRLKGLYCDMKLYMGMGGNETEKELDKWISEGYDDEYLKEESEINAMEEGEYEDEEDDDDEYEDDNECEEDEVEKARYKGMVMECDGYSGCFFTTGDVDYIHAKVFIEPFQSTKQLIVRSQIYEGDETFSDVLMDEFTLTPGTTTLTTTGWGNEAFNAYQEKTYRWLLEIEGKVYEKSFRFYSGSIYKYGMPLNDVKLFAAKESMVTETDKNNYKTTFVGDELEYLYFKLFFDKPGEARIIQIFMKVIYLEDDSIFCNEYRVCPLNATTYACWEGVGYREKGKWKKGLYKYSIQIGRCTAKEGTFTVI